MAGGQRGQKTKLTEALAEALCGHLRQGHYRRTACALVGIHETTLSDWMGKAREPYLSLQKAVHEAEAQAEADQLAKITESPEPADAKWYLARKFPDRWAETRRVDVSGRLDMGIKLNANALSDERAREHIQGLTDWLFTDGDDSADSASESGE